MLVNLVMRNMCNIIFLIYRISKKIIEVFIVIGNIVMIKYSLCYKLLKVGVNM